MHFWLVLAIVEGRIGMCRHSPRSKVETLVTVPPACGLTALDSDRLSYLITESMIGSTKYTHMLNLVHIVYFAKRAL